MRPLHHSSSVLKLLAAGCALLVIARFCHEKTGKFELYKICSDLPFDKEWEVPSPSPSEISSLQKIFDQPFRFLGKGGQSFVFASDDGAYVIKFFRLSRLTPPLWLKIAPAFPLLDPYREKITLQRSKQLHADFSSTLTAWNLLREETGLLFCHLNKTDFLKKKLTLYDKIGVVHSIDLDQMAFVLQKRAELLYPHLEHLLQMPSQEPIKTALHDFLALLKARYEKGILDNDPNLKINFGFSADTPIQIDIGRFEKSTPTRNLQEELSYITHPLKVWLEEKDPSLAHFLKEQIHENQI